MTYVISERCVYVMDRACVDKCPVDCIYEGRRMLYVQPDGCVDCGACEPVFPVEAILYEADVPDSFAGYTRINSEFFSDIGSSGGVSSTDGSKQDHPEIAASWSREAAVL